MWICPNCHTENRDMASACQNCGAQKAAGRFGSSPVSREGGGAPRVRAASAPERKPDHAPAPISYLPPEEARPPLPPPSPLMILGRIVGWLLMILLPLGLAAFAWRQYDAVSRAVLPLLLDEGAAEAVSLLCYVALAVAAGLLAMLPGLWTLLLCRRPPRRDHQ